MKRFGSPLFYLVCITIMFIAEVRSVPVPDCPKDDNGIPGILYGNPPKCYSAGEKGPCDAHERLFIKPGSRFGVCNCDCFSDDLTNNFDFGSTQFCSNGGSEFVYHPQLEKCFRLNEQGPSQTKESLVKYPGLSAFTGIVRSKRSTNETYELMKRAYENMIRMEMERVVLELSRSIVPGDCETGTRYSRSLNRCIGTGGRTNNILGK